MAKISTDLKWQTLEIGQTVWRCTAKPKQTQITHDTSFKMARLPGTTAHKQWVQDYFCQGDNSALNTDAVNFNLILTLTVVLEKALVRKAL